MSFAARSKCRIGDNPPPGDPRRGCSDLLGEAEGEGYNQGCGRAGNSPCRKNSCCLLCPAAAVEERGNEDEPGNRGQRQIRMSFKRESGIVLHISSLPGDYGVGDLGRSAFRFIDLLPASKQGLWQILPLTPTGFGDSPYQSYSAFAGNTNMISPETLVGWGVLANEDLRDAPEFKDRKSTRLNSSHR